MEPCIQGDVAKVRFRNISLTPGHETDLRAEPVLDPETESAPTAFDPASLGQVKFGATRECVLSDYATGEACAVDFDTGPVFEIPEGHLAARDGRRARASSTWWSGLSMEQKLSSKRWAEEHGIDALVNSPPEVDLQQDAGAGAFGFEGPIGEPPGGALLGFAPPADPLAMVGLFAWRPVSRQVAEAQWRDPVELAEAILCQAHADLSARIGLGSGFLRPPEKGLPWLAFLTADGGVGIAQVTPEKRDEGTTLTLRYKTVQGIPEHAMDHRPDLWFTLLPCASGYSSVVGYKHMFRLDQTVATRADRSFSRFEVRSADAKRRVGTIPIASSPYRSDFQEEGLRTLGAVADGRYLVAMVHEGVRCSNVAAYASAPPKSPRQTPCSHSCRSRLTRCGAGPTSVSGRGVPRPMIRT